MKKQPGVLYSLSGFCILASAQAVAADPLSAAFDHATQSNAAAEISAAPGDTIGVQITNTCSQLFDYAYIGVQPSPAPASRAPTAPAAPVAHCTAAEAKAYLQSQNYCAFDSKSLSFGHEKKYVAYQITVSRKDKTQTPRGLSADDLTALASKMVSTSTDCATSYSSAVGNDLPGKPLAEATYIVEVPHSPWAVGMSGGLTISNVVDPRFAVVVNPNSTATPPAKMVIHDQGAEDKQALGFAGFIHIHNDSWKFGDIPIAGTLGFGIADKNSISGFVGVSATAWDLAYLTFGWNWRSVDRLPAGQVLNAAPISDNVLNNLPTRTDSSWFLGISYKLMSPGESFFTQKTATSKDTPAAPKPAS